MIYRVVAYSLILLGISGTVYIGFEGIFGDHYDVPSLSLETFNRQVEDSSIYVMIDVRTDSERVRQPVPWENSLHIPLLTLEDRCMELTPYEDQQIILLCPTGNRSRQGARLLRLAGFNAWYLENGMFRKESVLK